MNGNAATMAFVGFLVIVLVCLGCAVHEKIRNSGRVLSPYCRGATGSEHRTCPGRFPAPEPDESGFRIALCECPCHGCADCREGDSR